MLFVVDPSIGILWRHKYIYHDIILIDCLNNTSVAPFTNMD